MMSLSNYFPNVQQQSFFSKKVYKINNQHKKVCYPSIHILAYYIQFNLLWVSNQDYTFYIILGLGI